VYRGLAAGATEPSDARDRSGDAGAGSGAGAGATDLPAALDDAAVGPVLWFARKPRIGAVMEAVERVARRPE
ncbi:MAG: hypothetical protein GWN71_44255, partial [Gammaproteobacteria bacterium]|nr:hypothetical protein [Gemmatimonadota bacterium]NIU80303.1 hypothetical protein [Gammaproteobacteria bacterium]NIX23705.1 hypothetical protein [Actinomycetota bacterium]